MKITLALSPPMCHEWTPAPHVALPQSMCYMHGCSHAYELYLPWRNIVREGLHGMAPAPRGTLRSGFQHGAGDGGIYHMIQVALEVCFSVVMMRETCFWGLDCGTQNQQNECDPGVGGSMGNKKTLGRGVSNLGPLVLKPWLVKHGAMAFQGHLLGSYRKKDK